MSKRKMGLFYCRDFCILVHLIFQLCLGIWRIIVEIAIFFSIVYVPDIIFVRSSINLVGLVCLVSVHKFNFK